MRGSTARFFQVLADRAGPPPIQVILTCYASVEGLLSSFDIDAACVCFLPNEQKVWATQRGLRALQCRGALSK